MFLKHLLFVIKEKFHLCRHRIERKNVLILVTQIPGNVRCNIEKIFQV